MWHKTLSWGKIHTCLELFYLLFHLHYFISLFSPILGFLSLWTLTWFSGGLRIVRFMIGLNGLKGLFEPKWLYDFCDSVFCTQCTHTLCFQMPDLQIGRWKGLCSSVSLQPLFLFQSQQWLYLSIFNGKTPIPFTWSGSVALLYPLGDLKGKNLTGPVSVLDSLWETGTPYPGSRTAKLCHFHIAT